MKNQILYKMTIITLLLSNITWGQTKKDRQFEGLENTAKIVEKLKRPTKTWVNGVWIIKNDGSKVWQAGYWNFEEKSFQEKSQFLRRKRNIKSKV